MSSDQTPPPAGHQTPDDNTFALRIPAYAALTPLEREKVEDPTAEWPVHIRFESVKAALTALSSDAHVSEVVAVSVVEFANRWSFCKRQIETFIRQGLPLVGRGRARRVLVAEGDEWMRSHADGTERRMQDAARRHSSRA